MAAEDINRRARILTNTTGVSLAEGIEIACAEVGINPRVVMAEREIAPEVFYRYPEHREG